MKNILLLLLIGFSQLSYSQSLDSAFFDREAKIRLLKTIDPNPLVDNGVITQSDFYDYSRPVLLNNDKFADFIYYGPSGDPNGQLATNIYLNLWGKLERIGGFYGEIRKITRSFPNMPTEIHIVGSNCCDDPHLSYEVWSLVDKELIRFRDYQLIEKTQIPDCFNFRFSIRVKNTPYFLRATPEIINEDFDYHYKVGNILAEYSKGDIGHVLDSTTDNTGKVWYFVLMDKPRRIDEFMKYGFGNDKEMLGWISSRFVDIINYGR